MVWFFERDDKSLRLETRYDNDRAEFVALVRYPDGREETERFTAIDKFHSWVVAFERNLEVQNWTNPTGPIILPYGWPNPRRTD
jgi:hypothetical protein